MDDDTAAAMDDLPDLLFERADETDDAEFYREPRLVTHIDDATIAALTAFYAERLRPGARVLDLMSSWISHLPSDLPLGRVEGLGMNAEELAANARLDAWRVQDLNEDQSLGWLDESFDAVLIAVSVQYLTAPVAVFAEIARILAPGGELVIATSHRCFPTKAIRAFQALPPGDRMRLLAEFVRRADGFGAPEFHDRSPGGADPLWILTARRAAAGFG